MIFIVTYEKVALYFRMQYTVETTVYQSPEKLLYTEFENDFSRFTMSQS